MSIPWDINFDSGTNGAVVATGGAITAKTGSPLYTTDAAHGGMAARFTATTATVCIRADTGSTGSHSFRAYIKCPAVPTAGLRLFTWGDIANTVTAFNLRLHTTGKMDLADATTVVKKTSTTSPPVNAYYRIEGQVDNSDPSNPIVTIRRFDSMESSTVSEEISWTFAGTTVALDRINAGVIGSAAGGTSRDVIIDSFEAVSGLVWMGAKNPPAPSADYIIPGPYVQVHSGSSAAATQLKFIPPKSVVAGDLMLGVYEISATQSPAPTLPSGWALVPGTTVLEPSNANCALIYKYAVSGDLGTERTLSWTTPAKASFLYRVYGGVHATLAFNAVSSALKSGATTNHPAPAVTSAADAWRVNAIALKASTIWALAPPVGHAGRGVVYGLGGSANALGFSDSGANLAAGVQAAQDWTTDLAAGAGGLWSVMLKSAAAASGRVFYAHTDFVTIGAALQTSVALTWHGNYATALSVKYSVNSDMSSPTTVAGTTTPDADGYAHLSVTGLTAGTQYYFQIFDTPSGGSATATSDIVKAKTLKPAGSPQNFTVAHGACQTNESLVSSALDNMRTYNADVNFHLGDVHYYNPPESDQVLHQRRYWSALMNSAGTKPFFQSLAVNVCGSDHDRGPSNDNGDSNQPFNEFSIKAAKNVFPHHVLGDARNPTIGLYYSFVIGRVRFICVDIRNSERSPGLDPDNSAKTMLGATQKAWLKDRLLDPEPVKVIVSDEGWNHSPTTLVDRAAWWSYSTERTEIGDFIVANGVRAYMIHGNDHKLACDDGTSNSWGGFPVVCAAPFDNVGGGSSVAQQEYATDFTTRGSQYGRLAVTDDGTTITFAWQGWDALTNTQKIAMTTAWTIPTYEGPQIFGGAGDFTTGSAVSPATNVTMNKPANLVNNNQLVALVFNRTFNVGGFTPPSGFNFVGKTDSTYNMAVYVKQVPVASSEPANYTFTGAAGGRTVGILARASGIHPTAPVDVAGVLAAVDGTVGIVLPGLDPATDDTLLVGFVGAGRSNATPNSFAAPTNMQLIANASIVDGASSSDIAMFTEARPVGTPTGTRTSPITNTAANSVGFMVAFRAASSPVPPAPHHMVLGGVTSSKVVVTAKVNGEYPVRIAASTSIGMTSPVYSSVTDADAYGYLSAEVTGLAVNTQYYFALELDGIINTSIIGKARTFPLEGSEASFSFAAGSCAVVGSNDTVFDSIRTRPGLDGLPARFFAHLGDLEYTYSGLTAPNDPDVLMSAWETVFAQSRQAQLYRDIPVDYVFSDVDWGGSNTDGTWVGKTTKQAMYRQMWANYPLPSTVGGVQHAYTIGRVRFIHTDGRSLSSSKSATDNSGKSLLGAEQKAWLKNELLRDEPVKVWFHDNDWGGTPLTPDGIVDQWRVYSTERAEIATFITTNNLQNEIYYICGDTHTLMADSGVNNPYGGFARVCVAPMHQQANTTAFTNSNGAFPTAGTVTTAHQYGWFDVVDAGATITVAFKGYDGDGTLRISMDKVFTPDAARTGMFKRWNGTDWDWVPTKVFNGTMQVVRPLNAYNGTTFVKAK